MPLTPNFTVTQLPGTPEVVTITDTSTGSNVDITQRRVTIQDSLNNYLVPPGTLTDYIQWALVDTSIDVENAITKDYALTIKVDWLDVSNAVINTKTEIFYLTGYNDDFDYTLTQMLVANPMRFNDANFFENKIKLRHYMDEGVLAVSRAVDLYLAQVCFDEATKIRNNKSSLLNINV